ncbi:MAG: TonB-dependent receptor [Gemmatimonadaceae bacterium]|nr:TonB-dependent receptor [Gemmatimonadaceae bacterium]
MNETLDAGRATSKGAEGSIRVQLTDRTSAFATFGYIDAKFDSTDANGNQQARSGNRFRLTPMHSASAGYTFAASPTRYGQLSLSPNATFRSKVFFEDTNLPNIAEEQVLLFNARAEWRMADKRTDITLVVRNLFDQQYIIDAGNTGGAFGIPTFIAGAPRFVTLQISRSF